MCRVSGTHTPAAHAEPGDRTDLEDLQIGAGHHDRQHHRRLQLVSGDLPVAGTGLHRRRLAVELDPEVPDRQVTAPHFRTTVPDAIGARSTSTTRSRCSTTERSLLPWTVSSTVLPDMS
jgi:hypothetical protein